jgi:hypothetical protein
METSFLQSGVAGQPEVWSSSAEDGHITGLTPIGRATAWLLQMNT